MTYVDVYKNILLCKADCADRNCRLIVNTVLDKILRALKYETRCFRARLKTSVCPGFGENAAQILQVHDNNPDQRTLTEAGLIAALRNVTVDVYEGETFVIMGLSGSGKSTLVRCFTRLIEATVGSVSFDGQVLQDLNAIELNEVRRHKMGTVFQHFALLPHQ